MFQRFLRNLGPREGGTANRPLSHDRGRLTHKGISTRFLSQLRNQKPHLKLPADPRQITPKQRANIFRSEFFDRANVAKVAAISGVQNQASKLPEQLFDTAVLHGPESAGAFLQEALDTVLGTDLRIVKGGKKQYDGIVGSQTRAAIARAARQGSLRAVNNQMVIIRERNMRADSTFPNNPGWIPRARSFRMP